MKKSKHFEILSTVICGLLSPGDEVVCVDARGMDGHMSAGDRFTVKRVTDGTHLHIKNDDFEGQLLAYRFRPVPKPLQAPISYKETFKAIRGLASCFTQYGEPPFQPDELILVRDSELDGWMTGRFVKMDGDRFVVRHVRPRPLGVTWDRFWRMAIKFDPEKAERV